jgi:hypothetical protein
MSTYSQIAWLPLCGGLTGLGLVMSWFVFRRRGFAAGLRGLAWSLLPLAAYLTGAIEMIWKMAAAIGSFATSFVFSPSKWAGLAVAGVAFVAFVVSGLLRRGRPAKDGKPRDGKPRDGKPKDGRRQADKPADGAAKTAPARKGQAIAARSGTGVAGADDDDDFREIEKILRNRGIS